MQPDERAVTAANETPQTLSRREFVRRLSGAAAGGTLITAAFAGCALSRSQRAEAGEAVLDRLGKLPKVKMSKRLGGMEIGRVCLCQDSSPDLVGPSIAAGMNFFHKAGYWGRRGGVPDEVKALPRESYFCDITVDNTSPGHDPTNEAEAYDQVTQSLDRTGLKYFDIFRAHYGWRSLDSFSKGDNASYRAFKRLKREGKVRYFGVSQHSAPREPYERYATMIQAQIDSGLVDSMQLWFSYASTPDELAIFEKAHKAGIGITAMKTNEHGYRKMQADAAKQEELKAPGMPGRAAIRYVLTLKGSDGKPFADCCVSSLRNFSMLEENLGAVAAKVAAADGVVVAV